MEVRSIIKPKISDFDLVMPILNLVFSKYPDFTEYNSTEAYSRTESSKGTQIFFIKESNDIIGFAICYERYPGFYHIWQLGILEDFRGKGMGSKIYDSIEKYAQENGFKGVTMNTFNTFAESLRLAIKRNYKIDDINKEGTYASNPKIKLKLEF